MLRVFYKVSQVCGLTLKARGRGASVARLWVLGAALWIGLRVAPTCHELKPLRLSWIAAALDTPGRCLCRLWARKADIVSMFPANRGCRAF